MDYLPGTDEGALTWMQNFSSGITANPALYQLMAADATTISSAVTAFATALAVSSNPATRTPVTVATKDDAKTSAEQVCRQYAQMIKLNAGISDPDKIAIGVPPVNTTRSPIPAPSSSPLLDVIGATPGQHTLRFADSGSPDSRKKPFGAMNLQLFRVVGTAPANTPDDADFVGAITKNPVEVGFDFSEAGKTATYFARWANRRGEVGPWSAPVSMTIAA
jgi:hypothetical protein